MVKIVWCWSQSLTLGAVPYIRETAVVWQLRPKRRWTVTMIARKLIEPSQPNLFATALYIGWPLSNRRTVSVLFQWMRLPEHQAYWHLAFMSEPVRSVGR